MLLATQNPLIEIGRIEFVFAGPTVTQNGAPVVSKPSRPARANGARVQPGVGSAGAACGEHSIVSGITPASGLRTCRRASASVVPPNRWRMRGSNPKSSWAVSGEAAGSNLADGTGARRRSRSRSAVDFLRSGFSIRKLTTS